MENLPKYYPPIFNETKFHCALCGIYSQQKWYPLVRKENKVGHHTKFSASQCDHCKEYCFWYGESMIVPEATPVPPAHQDMPENCKEIYDEARAVVSLSPKAAAALLRLCLQLLLEEIGENGKNIDSDIDSLVIRGLLPVEIQQILNLCRVVGDDVVLPGKIELSDNLGISRSLFEIINFVVDDRISRPKKVTTLLSRIQCFLKKTLGPIGKKDENAGRR